MNSLAKLYTASTSFFHGHGGLASAGAAAQMLTDIGPLQDLTSNYQDSRLNVQCVKWTSYESSEANGTGAADHGRAMGEGRLVGKGDSRNFS